jgi:hypothetical protein
MVYENSSLTDFLILSTCSMSDDSTQCIKTTVSVGWFILWVFITIVMVNLSFDNLFLYIIGWSILSYFLYSSHVNRIMLIP